MELALTEAGLKVSELQSIIACANSSPGLDLMEARAIKRIAGDRVAQIRVSAIKSMLGEFNSSGGLRVVASALSLQHQWIPPTINYLVPDPACDLSLVSHTGQAAELENTLINGSSNGGSHIALLLQRFVE
jgi:3-oxoacyl-[acyl-carrier-protein] synthase II